MMRATLFTTVVATAALSTAHADGIIFQLPKDGAWVQYRMVGKEVDGGDGDKKVFRGTVMLSSVGVETVKGKKCRWIELRNTACESSNACFPKSTSAKAKRPRSTSSAAGEWRIGLEREGDSIPRPPFRRVCPAQPAGRGVFRRSIPEAGITEGEDEFDQTREVQVHRHPHVVSSRRQYENGVFPHCLVE